MMRLPDSSCCGHQRQQVAHTHTGGCHRDRIIIERAPSQPNVLRIDGRIALQRLSVKAPEMELLQFLNSAQGNVGLALCEDLAVEQEVDRPRQRRTLDAMDCHLPAAEQTISGCVTQMRRNALAEGSRAPHELR
eukprot:607709-Prymnesium_polylepis.1